MKTHSGRRIFVGHDLKHDLRRLEVLLRDLNRIATGRAPTAAELASAPLLDEYEIVGRPTLCLMGRQVGHPTVRGERIVTSELWAFAEEQGWARTLSRFYRLGRPFGTANDA